MVRSGAMRSLVSGWVENILINVRPENGLTIIRALTGAVLPVGGSGLD
jgi:hypothetical protein